MQLPATIADMQQLLLAYPPESRTTLSAWINVHILDRHRTCDDIDRWVIDNMYWMSPYIERIPNTLELLFFSKLWWYYNPSSLYFPAFYNCVPSIYSPALGDTYPLTCSLKRLNKRYEDIERDQTE